STPGSALGAGLLTPPLARPKVSPPDTILSPLHGDLRSVQPAGSGDPRRARPRPCGEGVVTGLRAVLLCLFQPGHAVARFREPDKHPWIVARNDETRIRRNLLHAILRCQV